MGSLSGKYEMCKLTSWKSWTKNLLDIFSRWRDNNEKKKKKRQGVRMWTEFVCSRTESRNWLIWIHKTWTGDGGIFTGFGTRGTSRMDLFQVMKFFRSAVSTECRHHVVSIYNLYSTAPGFKSWQTARFFHVLSNFIQYQPMMNLAKRNHC
jgi:hypothetical protein